MTGRTLHLSDALAAQILNAAARSYPCECCGLIEGVSRDDGWQAIAVHDVANVAENPTRHFQINPQTQFDLMRALRGSDRRIIGCFHSHPDGVTAPSAIDRANAYESDFLWLIVGGSGASGFTLGAHHFAEESGFTAVILHED